MKLFSKTYILSLLLCLLAIIELSLAMSSHRLHRKSRSEAQRLESHFHNTHKTHKRYLRKGLSKLKLLRGDPVSKATAATAKTTEAAKKTTEEIPEIDPDNEPDVKAVLENKVLMDLLLAQTPFSIGPLKERVCPLGYELVLDAVNKDNVASEINHSKDSPFFYLCAKYKRLADFKDEPKKPINSISIEIATIKCNDSDFSFVELNKTELGGLMKICYGTKKYHKEEEQKMNIPIKKVITRSYELSQELSVDSVKSSFQFMFNYSDTIVFKGEEYECLFHNLNFISTKRIHICFTRQVQSFKSIEIKDVNLHPNSQMKIYNPDQKYVQDEIIVENGSSTEPFEVVLKRADSISKKTQQALTQSAGFGINVDLTFYIVIYGVPVGNVNVAIETSINMSNSNIQSNTAKTTSLNVSNCTVPPGRFFKCQQTVSTKQYSFAFTFRKVYTLFDGRVIEKQGQTNKGTVNTEDVESIACCIDNCTANDAKCPGATTRTAAMAKCATPNYFQTNVKTNSDARQQTVKDALGLASDYVVVDVSLEIVKEALIGFASPDTASRFSSGDESKGTSYYLKKDSDGNKVFIVLKRKQLSSVNKKKDSLVNQIYIQYGNDNCGNLKKAQTSDFKSNISSSDPKTDLPIFLCYGYDKDLTDAPITDIEVTNKTGTASIDANKESTITYLTFEDLGLKPEKNTARYLKVTRNLKIPKRVDITNYEITGFIREDVNMPTAIDTIVSDGGAQITRTYSNTSSTEVTETSGYSFGGGVEVNAKFGSSRAGFEIGLGIKANYNRNEEKVETTKIENYDSQEVTCKSVSSKYRCNITKNTQRIVQDYKYIQTFISHKNEVIKKQQVVGTASALAHKNLSVSSCCTDCTEDLNCSDYDTCRSNIKSSFEAQKTKQLSKEKVISFTTTDK